MSDEELELLDKFELPYGREVKAHAVRHASGMAMLRLNIREGRRFTILDIDARAARHWAELMNGWADNVDEQ